MTFETAEIQDGVMVVRLIGDMDLYTCDGLDDVLNQAVAQRSGRVVVDLARTTFVDSMALGLLIGAGRRAREAGGALHLASPLSHVRRTLALLSLDRLIPMFPSVQDAAAAFGPEMAAAR